MAETYEATDSATGVHDFVTSPKHKRVLVNVGGGDRDTANTESYTFVNSETGVWLYGCADVQAFTNPEPGADGDNTGTFTMTFEITVGDANVRFDDVILHRVNSSGVSQASVSTGTSVPVSMAAGTHAFTFASPALGTWAAGDYLGVEVQYTNTSDHGGDEIITFQFGNTALTTKLDVPFTLPGGGGPSPGLRTLALTGAGI